jgi:hypothetical protein
MLKIKIYDSKQSAFRAVISPATTSLSGRPQCGKARNRLVCESEADISWWNHCSNFSLAFCCSRYKDTSILGGSG